MLQKASTLTPNLDQEYRICAIVLLADLPRPSRGYYVRLRSARKIFRSEPPKYCSLAAVQKQYYTTVETVSAVVD